MEFKTKPYAHQLECLDKFGKKEVFALLAEMGTGKTWIIINNIARLWDTDSCDAVLVLAPNGVHTNWTRLEIPAHMPDEVEYDTYVWSAAQTKKNLKELKEIYVPDKSIGTGREVLRIFSMNHEALQTKKGFDAAMNFVESTERCMIVVDESDAFKNPKAKRTKNLMKLKPYSVTRRTMTGTPVNNSPFDVFSQFNFLHKKILNISSFFAFKAEFAQMLPPDNALVASIRDKRKFTPQIVATGVGGKKKYRNLDVLARLIAPHSFRVLKKDCLDLPDKIYKTLFFDLTPQQKEVYKKAKEECRLVFEDEETPFNKLVAMGKLAQITSGYYIHPLSEEPVRIDGATPKLDLLMETVQRIISQGDKIIIWARFRIEIADIVARLKELKIKSVELHGGIKKKQREENIDCFENGDALVFVANPSAGGTGITLVAASYAVYFSNDFSYQKRAQSEDRNHRIGQVKNVTYINIAAKKTIDEIVISALLHKRDVATEIIDRGLNV